MKRPPHAVRSRQFASLLLSSAIAATLNVALTVPAFAGQQGTELPTFDIAAQPLPAALAQFARQSTVPVDIPAGLGGVSAPIRGQMPAEAALAQLLAGSGWIAVRAPQAGYRLQALAAAGMSAPLVTAPLAVTGHSAGVQGYQASRQYSQRELQSIPGRNGHLTNLLRINPAVQLDNNVNSSNRPGDLEPADISIHGAKFWQNQFMVDGMSVNNDINPGNRNYAYVNASVSELHGNPSQGIALDIGLVERVDVHDSNVSAEYGGFNGGVVNAVTRMPAREFAGSISTTHTRNAWARYHIDSWKQAEFYDTPAIADGYVRNQPEFETTTWRLNLEGHLSDTFGVIGSFTRKHSDIYNQRVLNQSMRDNGAQLEAFTSVFRQIDNYFLKSVWSPAPHFMLETVFNHEPHQSEHFNRNAKDGDFIIDGGGTNAGLTATWEGDRLVQTHKLNWSTLEHSRTGGPGWFARWRHSEQINWGDPRGLALYGTFGDLYQQQDSLGYQLKLEWSPLPLLGGEHRFALGGGIVETEAAYQRRQAYTDGGIPALRPTRTCTDANGVVDTRHCSASPLTTLWPGFAPGDGQYASYVDLYLAGQIKVDQRAWSLWAEDDIQMGRARLRPGLRIDADNYMDKATVAPRLAFEYDLSGNGHSRLTAGANRYYGRNVFDYALREGREQLHYRMSRGPDLVWDDPVPASLNTTVFRQLEVPYDDEWMLGLRQLAWDTAIELKYVQRQGHDQIRKRRVSGPVADPGVHQSSHYRYENSGRSRTRSLALTVQPLREIAWAGTSTTAQLIANWTEVESNHESYSDVLSDEVIQYQGRFMAWDERPLENYNRPWTARILTQTSVPALGLTIGNYLGWRGPFSAAMATGRTVQYQSGQVDVYERRRFGTSMTWDLRLAWERRLGVQQETVFSNLDITNVLDRTNTSAYIEDWQGSYAEYELGRHFQLEIGYRF